MRRRDTELDISMLPETVRQGIAECMGDFPGSATVRTRTAILMDSLALTVDGAGAAVAPTNGTLFQATAADDITPAVRKGVSLSTMRTAGKTGGDLGFVGLRMGFRAWALTPGTVDPAIVAEYLSNLIPRIGLQLDISGSSRPLGSPLDWPWGGAVITGAQGDLAAGASAAALSVVPMGNGIDIGLSPIVLRPNDTFQAPVTIAIQPPIIAAAANVVYVLQGAITGIEVQRVATS